MAFKANKGRLRLCVFATVFCIKCTNVYNSHSHWVNSIGKIITEEYGDRFLSQSKVMFLRLGGKCGAQSCKLLPMADYGHGNVTHSYSRQLRQR